MIYVGIDPGINNGVALWGGASKKFTAVESMPLFILLESLKDAITKYGTPNMMVIIEDPHTFIPFKQISKKELDSRLQGAGAVKQTYKHIIEFLEHYKVSYTPTRLQKTLKKMSAEKFKQQTGWQGRTNEHGRDAACLVLGR